MHASILTVIVAGACMEKSKSHLKHFSIETVFGGVCAKDEV